MVTNLEVNCRLLSRAFGVPVVLADEKDMFYQNVLRGISPSAEYPSVMVTPYREQFFSFAAPDGQKIVGGPCLPEEISDRRSSELAGGLNARQKRRADYYRTLPVIERKQWEGMARLAYFTVHGTERAVQEQNAGMTIENPDLRVSERKQSMSFHHDPSHEQKLMSFIRKGNVREVKKLVQSGPEDGGEFGVLSRSSYVRSQKNLAIASITLATRAAMEGGVYPEMAYTLSDVYIQRLEELSEVRQVDQLVQEALCAFAGRVQRAKNKEMSPVIVKCQRYINEHVYEPLSLTRIAHYAELSPSHVSAAFKKETGFTVSEAIQKARIEEAESLLMLTAHPIAVIGAWLQFTDQSHFTKVFKKYTGQTPKQYRQAARF
ncbi:helix-turn-helix domain-containing protein [Domibacillus indicus]|uniref:helix-turn-helix domain-containing protein n=1 Tax=Domibacillus indicus TaxID=1437523 RepID=UPI000AA93E88|nr:helix-turn-helix domain-containing protein [Domibacillus indicus]